MGVASTTPGSVNITQMPLRVDRVSPKLTQNGKKQPTPPQINTSLLLLLPWVQLWRSLPCNEVFPGCLWLSRIHIYIHVIHVFPLCQRYLSIEKKNNRKILVKIISFTFF